MLSALVVGAIQSTVLMALALVTVRFFGSASVRHAILTGAVLGSLVLPAASNVLPKLSVALPVLFAPISAGNEARVALPDIDDGSDGDLTRRPTPVRSVAAQGRSPLTWPDIVIALWLAGAMVVIARTVVSHRRAWKVQRQSSPVPAPVRRALTDAASQLGSSRAVDVRLNGVIDSAATTGCVRPVILLPLETTRWSPQQQRAVLLHELAHVERRDCLVQLLTQVACAIYWFNPLAHLAARRIGVERELACDDMVVAAGVLRTAYADVLLMAARAASTGPCRAPMPLLSLSNGGHLEERVRRILNASVPLRLGRLARLLIAVGCTATVMLVGVVRIGFAQSQPVSGEPDLRGDSVARPTSELIALPPSLDSGQLREALAGPDSTLAKSLVAGLARVPRWEGDLVRARSTWALAQTRRGKLVEPLIGALADGDWRVRAYAAWALAESQDRRATPALVKQLTHPVWRMRAMAAYALAASGDPTARRAMAALLLDPAWQVRASVVTYLGRQHDPALLPVLRQRLDDRHVMVRMAAAQAVAEKKSR